MNMYSSSNHSESFPLENWGTVQFLSTRSMILRDGGLSLIKAPQWFFWGLSSKSHEHLELSTFSMETISFTVKFPSILTYVTYLGMYSGSLVVLETTPFSTSTTAFAGKMLLFSVPLEKFGKAFFNGELGIVA